jgi:hypothetical protein
VRVNEDGLQLMTLENAIKRFQAEVRSPAGPNVSLVDELLMSAAPKQRKRRVSKVVLDAIRGFMPLGPPSHLLPPLAGRSQAAAFRSASLLA